MERIRALLPADARVRRDRGPGLFVSRQRVDGTCFYSEQSGALWRVRPTAALVSLFEREAPSGALAISLLRFRGRAVERASIRLFCEAAKLSEAPDAARAAALERAIRQRAALCLRAGGGGGLYGCAVLFDKIGGIGT